MIKSIVLNNWKSHEHTELEFSKGTSVLVGQMGSGKTSVMDAISFALFGTFPALQSRKIKLDQCIMDKPEEKQQSIIKLAFDFEGKDYEITRTIERGKGTTGSEFRENGDIIENANSKRVTEAVTQKLHVDYELFSRAVYSEQNQIDYFLQIPSGQRKKKIDELLKLDKFEKARGTTTTVINRLKTRAKDRQEAIEGMKEEDISKKINELKESIDKLEQENEQNKKKLEQKNQELEKLKTEASALEKKEAELRENEKKTSSIKGEVNSLEEKTKEIEEKLGKFINADLTGTRKELEQKLQAIQEQIKALKHDELQEQISALDSKIGSLKAKKEDLQKKTEEQEKNKKKLEELEKQDWDKKQEEQKKQLKKLEEQLAQSKMTIKTEEKRLNELESLHEQCPVCDSKITPEKREELKQKSREKIKENQEKSNVIQEQIKNIDLETIEQKIKELEKTKEKIKELDVKEELEKTRKELEETEKQLQEKKKKREETSKQKEELDQKKDEIKEKTSKIERIQEKQDEYKKATETKEKKKKEIQELENKKKEIAFNPEKLRETRQKTQETGNQATEIKTRIESTEKLKEEKNARMKELEQNKEQIKKWEKELKKLEKNADEMEKFKSALESAQNDLREQTLLALNAGTEDIWPKIYPYGDYTSLKLALDSGDYVLQLKRRDGNWVNVEGIASGGERSTACLALRISFALVLTQNLSWLVLDEPTHNLDSQGVETVSIALRENLPELVEQIFIITHEDAMETAVSGSLYRFERQKELDEPTKATRINESQ